ncbi:uncharacterized protein [Procambarus clarkii]|uniref:uncharacterized protein isoform X2 n=1 Tax=Procambarus clarkii TaxID=6728 RepID=UPI0037440E1A
MRPPAQLPVPPLLLVLSHLRSNYRCLQLVLLLLLLLSARNVRAGRGRRATSLAPDLLPLWLPHQQVTNMSRELHDSWGACGHSGPEPQQCHGHVHHLRHHGRGHCNLRPEELVKHVCNHSSKRRRLKLLEEMRPPTCGPWGHSSYWRREVAKSANKCFTALRHLLHMDDLARAATCRFASILSRYDCPSASTFVTAHLTPGHNMCFLCQEAYRYWVCSQLFPYYVDGVRVKPCRRFCHDVEQKCPYFLPRAKPVAGEPTFLCQDPKIGELEEQESSYGSDACCYHTCPPHQVLGYVKEVPEHQPLPSLCSTCHTSTTTTTTITASSSSSTSSSDASTFLSPTPRDNHKANHSQCLSASDADSCSLHPAPSPLSPLRSAGSSSTTVITRKHCWTRTALYILLLYLVRTRVLLPRGFT